MKVNLEAKTNVKNVTNVKKMKKMMMLMKLIIAARKKIPLN